MNKELLSREDILKLAEPFPSRRDGVYFLIKKDKIVYVGESIDVDKRIIQHIQEKKKSFDRFAFIECGNEYICELEAEYIAKLSPVYNKKLTVNEYTRRWKNTKKVKRESGLTWPVFNRLIESHKIKTFLHCIDTFAFKCALKKEFPRNGKALR